MTDRNDMDRPAAVTAFALGIILIGVSIPLLLFVGDDAKTTYDVSWTESSASAATASQGAMGQATRLTVQFADILPSNVSVSFTCNDNRGPGNLAAAATVSWSLKRTGDDAPVLSGTSCAGATAPLEQHPDIASISADSEADALASVWAGVENQTGEYVLEFTWSRAQTTGPLPLPPQGTSFTATLNVGVLEWTATVSKPTAEVAK